MKTIALSITLFAILFASGGHILYKHICKIDSDCETVNTLSAFALSCESKVEQKKSCHSQEANSQTENEDCCDVIQQFDAQNQILASFFKFIISLPEQGVYFTLSNAQPKIKELFSTYLNKPPPRLKIRYHIAFQQFIC